MATISFDGLKIFVENFLAGDKLEEEIMVGSKLRRSIRQFKKLYPQLYYFAYGLGEEYKLVLSKKELKIDFFVLTSRCKKFFIEYTGLKISPLIDKESAKKLEPYLELEKWFGLLSDALIFVGGEKDFVSKHYDIEKQIWADLKNSKEIDNWKNKIVVEQKLLYKQNPIKINLTGAMFKSVPMNYPLYIDKKMNCGIYSPYNDKRYFISIDMKAANFQVLRMNGLISTKNWTEYL